jgi:GT2 family glycosyltransferase
VPEPEIAVVVASHERPLRLRWLLNALEEQTLSRERFEVVVCHDSGEETERLLREHPLGVRHVRLTPGTGGVGRQRNVAWREARAPWVAFTDDDCRPPAEWLERLLAACRPGAIVQGTTKPDPDELGLVRCTGWRSQDIDPPVLAAQGCNIAYPRAVLESLGGFDEGLEGGEDTELAARAVDAGAALVGAPDALTYHAIDVVPFLRTARAAWRFRDLPGIVRRHPRLREPYPLRIFWKPRHAWLGLAVAGVALARRRPWLLALALPWARAALPSYGSGPRGRARAVAELPRQAAVDLAEMGALAVGSVRQRSLLL